MAINFPADFLSNIFIFQTFIPFIILFAILWGLLEAIGIFKSYRTNLVIALGFSSIAAFTNPWILAYIATLGSYAAVVLFGALFLFGVIRWGLSRGRDVYFETSSYQKQIANLTKQKAKLEEKLGQKDLDRSQAESIVKQIKDLETKIRILEARL